MINFCLHNYKVPVSKYNIYLFIYLFSNFLHFSVVAKQSPISVLQALSDISLTGMKPHGCTKLFDSLIVFIYERITPKKTTLHMDLLWLYGRFRIHCYSGQTSLLSEGYWRRKNKKNVKYCTHSLSDPDHS